jgi:DNA-binding response OmpR family regulator
LLEAAALASGDAEVDHVVDSGSRPGEVSLKARVLSIEDDPQVGRLIRKQLEFEGFEVEVAETAASGLRAAAAKAFDLILLDLSLPDRNGFEVCAELRERGVSAPVIFVSARGDVVDKVRGLDSGGDDYITKPFSHHELSARIRAVLRRARGGAGSVRQRAGSIELEPEARRVFKSGREVELTRTELELIEFLFSRQGEVVTREQILEAVWSGVYVNDRTVDAHIRGLREKLEDEPGDPSWILTAHGRGYRLREDAGS